MDDGVGDGDDGCGDGGGYGVELLNASKFNSGVDRARNADNEDKSSLLCARIFELNFVPLPPPPLPTPAPTGLLTAVALFVFELPVVVIADVASTTCAVAVAVLISSVAAGSNSCSVFNSRVAVVDAPAFCCNDGNSIFKLFGRSNFLCLYTAGRSVDSDESVDDDDDDDDDDIDMDVVVIGVGGGGACIIFFGVLKLLKRFMPDAGNAAGGDDGGDMLDFLAFSNALKCSG